MQWLQTDVDNQHPSHTTLLLSCQSEHNQYLMLIRNTQYYQCLTCERGLPNCQYFESQYYLAFVLINGRNDFAASNQVTRWTWRCLLKSSLSSIVASFTHLLENCEDEPKEAVDELDDREDGSSDPETQVPTDRPQERCKTLDIFSFAQYFIRLVLFFYSISEHSPLHVGRSVWSQRMDSEPDDLVKRQKFPGTWNATTSRSWESFIISARIAFTVGVVCWLVSLAR